MRANKGGVCIMKTSSDMDINTYLRSLDQVLGALETFNNKQAAIENIQIIETRINTALGIPVPDPAPTPAPVPAPTPAPAPTPTP